MSQLTDQHTPEHLEGALPTTGHRALTALSGVVVGMSMLALIVAVNPQAPFTSIARFTSA